MESSNGEQQGFPLCDGNCAINSESWLVINLCFFSKEIYKRGRANFDVLCKPKISEDETISSLRDDLSKYIVDPRS